MFAQPFDHSFNDLFNQYVNMESSNVDGNKDVSFSGGDLDQFFPLDSLSSDCGDLSPSGSTSKRSRRSSQPWGQDLWGVPQDTAASSSSEQGSFPSQDTIQPSAVSDLTFTVDASASSQPAATQGLLSSATPSTPPHTPRKKACTGSGITTPNSNRHPRDTNARRNQLRKQSFSPSLMRSSQTPKGRMACSDASAQRFHSFSFRNPDDHLPLSPPPSDILIQQENNLASTTTDSTPNQSNNRAADHHFTGSSADMSQQYDSNVFNQSPAISMPSPSANALARQQQKYMSQQSNPGMTTSPPSADEIFSSPHSSASQSLSSWYSDSLGASSFSFPSDLSGPDAQAWWSPMGSRVPTQRQQAYQQQQQQQQSVIASPTPQRPIQSHPEHQHDMFQGGLMIQFDQSFDMSGSANTTSFASSSAPAAAAAAATHETTATTSAPTYSQMPTTPQKFIHPTFTTPQMPHTQSSQSSPSLSPKTPGGHSRSPRNKFSATPSHPRTPGSAITKTPNRRSYESKMAMGSTPTTMPKPARTPGGSGGSMKGSNKSLSVSFVNFTPSDSKKILTGVAPSGSSKTKARREQEARDRRRKLSEAAMLAIRNAGGDIDSLEAILC